MKENNKMILLDYFNFPFRIVDHYIALYHNEKPVIDERMKIFPDLFYNSKSFHCSKYGITLSAVEKDSFSL
jgi:hypothetical protein